MCKECYHLAEKSFSLLPDLGFLYMNKKHRKAFSILEYGIISQVIFAVITGEIIADKTNIVR